MAKRRPNGDGTYVQRPNGTWEYRFQLPNGKRKSIYAKTFEEVQAKRKQAERDLAIGVDLGAKSQTVTQFLNTWLEQTARTTIRPRTYVSYKQLIDRHITPRVGAIKLDKLTPQHVQHMMNDMIGAGLSPTTVHRARAVLRRGLGYAVKWGYVPRNVATLVDPPRAVQKRVKPLTADQTRTFLAYVRETEPRLWPLFVTAAYTGLRAGELFGLRWSDVDLEARTIRVGQTVVQLPGGWSFGEPKTEKSARPLPLVPDVLASLKEQRARQLEERLACASWHEYDLVFATPVGTPLNPSNVNKQLHKALDRCGLPRMGLHGFRHGCASLMLAKGVHMRVVMEWLGHSQIALTMNTYSHVAPAVLGDAANAIEDALAGG